MKTVLAIQVLLVSFTLITAPYTGETSYHDDDDNVPDEIECMEPMDRSTQQDLVDITIIDEFEQKVNNIGNNRISEEDAEFIKDVKIKYWLSDSSPIKVEFENENALASSWVVGKPLKCIVHGWCYTRTGEPSAFSIKDAYINAQGYNVITIDWSTIASSKYYYKVARLSAQVGIILGHLLINLVRIGFVRPSDIHVIGHSLGAHVAAKSGNVFLHVMEERIDRITGLDPASPGFKDSRFCLWRASERLDKDDATFVDVVHTASGVQGISYSIGHVDFYPNNGKSPQPGCEGYNLIEMLHCSHSRAYVYYSESINNPSSFESWKCKSMKKFKDKKCIKNVKNFMGHHANRNDEGKFFLKTNDRSPYSKYSDYSTHNTDIEIT